MKLLHTSDWHIGKTLYGKSRYEEFEHLLNWLSATLEQEKIDALLVAGDIFDTNTPSNRAQELYYRFLCRVAHSQCRHIVIVAGNHDSPTFLTAPKALLKALHVHVFGSISDNLDEQILVLNDTNNIPELIVCAVPYLRDKDIRNSEAGETSEIKDQKMILGIQQYYSKVCELAKLKQQKCGIQIPIVATGHLFTAGGKTQDDDGVRELYVGSLGRVPSTIFPEFLDYVALGHLHVPQKVNGSEFIRYSGSPIAMGFGESKQQKSVCVIDFFGEEKKVTLLPVPMHQKLESVAGNWEDIVSQLNILFHSNSSVWIEIIYNGNEIVENLREKIDDLIEKSKNPFLDILRVKNIRSINGLNDTFPPEEHLRDIGVNEVFLRCLQFFNVPQAQHDILNSVYLETVKLLQESDSNAHS